MEEPQVFETSNLNDIDKLNLALYFVFFQENTTLSPPGESSDESDGLGDLQDDEKEMLERRRQAELRLVAKFDKVVMIVF